jgi:hypothetical protein
MSLSTYIDHGYEINVTGTDVTAFGVASLVTVSMAFPSVGFLLMSGATHILLRFVPTLLFVYYAIQNLPEITEEMYQVGHFLLQPRVALPIYGLFLASPVIWAHGGYYFAFKTFDFAIKHALMIALPVCAVGIPAFIVSNYLSLKMFQ